MSRAERLKYGDAKGGGGASVASSAAAMPGIKMERSEDLSRAERLKYGDANGGASAAASAAAMPGIKMERSKDLSRAERLKYGDAKGADGASVASSAAAMPGIKTERSEDLSKAEQLKYGQNKPITSPSSNVASDVLRSTRDIMQIAKSKSQRFNMQPRACQGDELEVREAENHNMAGDNNRDSEDGDSNHDGKEELSTERSAIQESEDDESGNNFDIENSSDGPMSRSISQKDAGKRRRSLLERYADFTYGIERDDYYDDDYDDYEDQVTGKRDIATIWKPCCLIISFLSLVIIIALGASLGASNKELANSEPDVVVDPESSVNVIATEDPTASPSLTPTLAPKDYSFCYDTEEQELQDERYSAIRSEIVSSGITSSDEFSDASSYQRKALCWLTFGDSLSLNQTDPFLLQRYALATIYFGLNESQILLDRGWLSGKPECQWTPLVECDSRTDSTVTRLSLHSNELVGELPKEIGYLQNTFFLDLSINQISDANAIRSWSKLKSLGLGTNSFTQIPNMSVFPYLKHFDVNGNSIEGVIPEDLSLNTNLVYLDLSENSFEQTIPTLLGRLVSLKTLLMDYNSLNGSMPSEICDLRKTNLVRLIADCQIPSPQIECPFPTCCTACGFGGQDSGEGQGSNPFQT